MPSLLQVCTSIVYFLAYSLQIILTDKVLFYMIYCIIYYVLCLYHAFSPVCTLSEMTKKNCDI